MPHDRRSLFDVRHHGIRRPAALAAAVVLALGIANAPAWASTLLTSITGGTSAGAPGFGGDGGPATAAQLNAPAGVVVDETGNVVLADTANQRVRRIDGATGVITTIAGGAGGGTPGFGGDGGPATSAQLDNPAGVAVDGSGNVLVADTANQRVRRIDAVTGVITTIAGGAVDATPGLIGDGGPATKARLANPAGVAVDGSGNVLVADTANQRVRRIDAVTGVITTIAGGAVDATPGLLGDGGPATKARLANPAGVAVDGSGNVLVADTANQRVRRIDAVTRVITTIAGGAAESATGFGGDGAPATAAQLNGPAGVAVDGAGNVLIADTANQRIRRIDGATGVIATVAGGAEAVVAGVSSDQPAPLGVVPPPSLASVAGPRGVAVDRSGVVLIANTPRNRIDKAVVDAASPTTANTPADPTALCQLVEGGGTAPVSTSPSWMTRTVSVSTPTAAPGERLAVAGNGFTPGQKLTVTLCSMPTVLGTITADPGGSYRANVGIPADVAPGGHHLVLSDASGNAAVALGIQARSGGDTGDDGSDPAAGDTGANGSDPFDEGADDGSLDTFEDDGLDDLGVIGADDGSELTTDSDGMPTTGMELVPLLYLAGVSLKLGGVLVLASRRRSPAS